MLKFPLLMTQVFGSAGVIGNPMGFARRVGLGVKDFLSVPAKGVLQVFKENEDDENFFDSKFCFSVLLLYSKICIVILIKTSFYSEESFWVNLRNGPRHW